MFRLNRADDAAREVKEVRNIEPAFQLDSWSASYPMAQSKQFDRLLSDLRKAGVREAIPSVGFLPCLRELPHAPKMQTHVALGLPPVNRGGPEP